MERNIDINEISDGKLYTAEDMVKAGCGSCEGCSACCRGMGSSVILDPLDVYRLTTGLSVDFQKLLSESVELNAVDGIILPNLKMAGEGEACFFLNEEGRCSIHSIRPGFCRLFPLGRLYEDGSFRYFLQTKECRKEKRAKVKVKKWIDTPDVKTYEKFVCQWHYFLKELGKAGTLELAKEASLYVLNQFYIRPYRGEEEFYPQFEERLAEGKKFAAELLKKG
jgi:hypothetical protein